MMLQELKQEEQKGTYAAVKYDEASTNKLKQFVDDNEIPNPVNGNKFHTTLLYSRVHCPDYKAPGDLSEPYQATPKGLEVWDSEDGETGEKYRCLVMKLDCDQLEQRHQELMDTHNATYDFDDYTPHITLSYDIGDLDEKKLPSVEDIGPLTIDHEYGEELKMDWSKDAGSS